MGTSIFDTVANESLDLMRESFESWKKVGYVRDREVLFKRKDGTVFPVLINATSIYDDNGNLIGSNSVIHDLSGIYSNKQTQLFEKEEFVNMITNELKSAALHIKNEAKALLTEDGGTTKESKERLEAIKLKSKSIVKMLSDISDMQKIQHGKMHLNKNIHDLSTIIESSISKLKDDVTFHRITIIKDIENDVLCLCDKNRIEQVLIQLIANAIDFSPKGTGKIHLKLTQVGKYVKIVVEDNGIGIKKDNLNKIFEKFYQLDTSIIREHGGAGLGLSICKGIIEGHDGKIWTYSRGLRRGTEIHVLLPLDDPNYYKIKKIK